MGNIFKNLFSHRHNLVEAQPIITRNDISQEVINAIGSCYDVLCQKLNTIRIKYYRSQGDLFLQQEIERELWVHFVNRRLSEFESNGRYHMIFDELLTQARMPWNQILDLTEFVCKWLSVNIEDYSYLEDLLKEFEGNLNNEFDRLDYGYRVVNHCIVDITSEEELTAINEAIENSKDNVSEHFQRAVMHYSVRPNPDVRNSIKESISAVEAVCRDLTGENTLGRALKRLEDNGVVIHKMLKEGFTKFYVYTNDQDSGIRHALMDDEGAYVPSKDEAYYMLVTCSTFVNYLRRKVVKKGEG
mgnify:CR=1 FL=1